MLIDTHAHLYLEQFSEDIDLVLKRAVESGVERIYMPNIDSSTTEEMIRLAKSYPDLCFPMMGLHPCSVKENYRKELDHVEGMLKQENFKAVGEIGIDLYWDKSFKEEQILAFEYQIDLAYENQLPIVIHSRDSLDLTIDIVSRKQNGNLRGIFHCFNGDIDQLQRIQDINFLVGLGGIITYKNANLTPMLEKASLDMIVLETDAPYLSPTPYRGKRNESSYVQHVAQKLSEIKELPVKEIISASSDNAMLLFESIHQKNR